MGQTRYIVAGRLIDGSGAPVQRNVFLAVQDTLISAIGPVAELPEHDRGVSHDLSHCTLVPALVDCSVSLSHSPSVNSEADSVSAEAESADNSAMLANHISYCHAHGVLGVADSGDSAGLKHIKQEGMPSGGMIDIRTSGPLCRSGQDCSADDPAGRDFVKIAYSATIEDEVSSDFAFEDFRRILQHRGEKKAVVVANGRLKVAEALEAGCDAIEQGYGMGEENLREMADKGVLWIPCLLRAKNRLDSAGSGGAVCCRFSQRFVAPGKSLPGVEAFWKKTLDQQLQQLRFAREVGVKAAVGTGAGSVGILHGEAMVEEMKLFMKAGYRLEEVMRAATYAGAAFFGMEKLGMLTVGRKATFLIARGTVQQLPRKLSYLEGIYVNGAPSAAYQKNF